jgi:hypothetical protein
MTFSTLQNMSTQRAIARAAALNSSSTPGPASPEFESDPDRFESESKSEASDLFFLYSM